MTRRAVLGVLPIAAIVAGSAALRFAGSRRIEAPWIAPDEMIYGLLGRSIWETGHGALIGAPGQFYGGYPLLVGLPLHLLGPGAGVPMIQFGQAILMSLTAAVVWAWARPLAGDGWALVAAGLTACLPALGYSSLLMSEAAFLPAATLALWLASRALARPSRGRQAALAGALLLACSARLQGAILVPVLVTAALLAAWFARDRRLFARLAPIWIALAAFGMLLLVRQLSTGADGVGVLGAYGDVVGTAYDGTEVMRFVLYHFGDLFLIVLGIPLVALGALTYSAARGREGNPDVVALLAVSASASLWLTLQVGLFASRYVGQLAERDLIVVAPPLFVCLSVWLARKAPRPQPATSIIAIAVAAPAVLLPLRTLVTPHAVPDAFMTVPLSLLQEATSTRTLEISWMLAAVALVALAVVVPRRAIPVLPVLVGVGLAATSVMATVKIADLTRADVDRFFGAAKRTWVDDAASGPVTYFYDGTAYWNGVWKTAFWNSRITSVARLPGPPLGSIPGPVVYPRYDGVLYDEEGNALEGREIVASTAFTFAGEPVAEIAQMDIDQAGLRLWRTADAPRLSTWTTGLKPNGDILETVRVYVYRCGQGQLELTLIGKQGTPIEVSIDGRPARRIDLASGGVWNGSVPTPATANGFGRCTFEINSAGLVGSTKIAFVRA